MALRFPDRKPKELQYLGQFSGIDARERALRHAIKMEKTTGEKYVVLAPDMNDEDYTHSVVTKKDFDARGKRFSWKAIGENTMDKKLKLITGAQDKAEQHRLIVERITTFASSINEDPKKLLEGATQVLAGLKTLMSQGEPLTKTGLSAASLAGVLAGIEVLTNNLAKLEPAKKTKALNVLGTLALGAGMSLNAVQAIAGLAEKNPNKAQYQQAFDAYSKTNKADPNLIKALGMLQAQVDQATRTAAVAQPTAPVSGGASPLGQPA